MNRRRFLASIGSVGAVSFAGCISSSLSRTISNPTEEREEDGETHLHFPANDDRLATLTIQPGRQRYAGPTGAVVPVDISISHRGNTKLTSLTLKLRAPPGAAGVPAQISMQVPQWSPHPSIELYTDSQDLSKILEIDDLGDQGDGTVTFEFHASLQDDSTSELLVDATMKLTAQRVLGRSYTLEGLTTVPLPKGTETG